MGRGNLAEETAAAIGLPAPEQQQETIRQLQHRASWQPPIKDDGTHIDEQDIVDVLVMGSGFCEGRFRIQEFFSATVLPTVKEQADWLKKEYGIGGRTWDFRDGERGFLDYDAKGLRIKRYASDNAPDHFRLLPWNEVARRLHLLVHNDKYLDENNKQGYEKWEAEQKAKRDARQAEIDYAEKTIADFCEREGLGAPDYSDLTHIDLAYSTTGDGEHEIQVYANFLRNEIVYTVSGELPEHKRFIYETAIPYFERRGIPTRVLRGQKTYLDCFYHIVSRGNAEGKLASFPLTGRCSIQRDCKLPPIRTYQKTLPQDTVYYLGIAADEPIRLARLKANQTSLLAKYNLTEKDAQAMCQAEGLLSPLYAFTGRGGCWFCPNASMRELRHLYNAHPDLWQLLLELQDAPNKATERFNRSYTLHDLDLRFCLEGEQLSLFSYGER